MPPPPDAYLGLVSIIVLIISIDSFILKVRSAFKSNPNIYGESVPGIVAMYSWYFEIYSPGLAGILYLKAVLSLGSPL